MTRFWRSLILAQIRRPLAFVVALALVAGLGAWRASHLALVTDFGDLLPQNQPSVVELKKILARTRGLANVFVVLEGNDRGGSDGPRLRRVADALVGPLGAVGGPWVESARSGLQEARRFLLPRAGLYLSDAQLDDLERRVGEHEHRAFRRGIGADLDEEPDGPDPLSAEQIEHGIVDRVGALQRYPEGYYQGRLDDGRVAQVIVVKSATPAGDLEGSRGTLERVRAVVAKTLATLGPDAAGLEVGYAGDLVTGLAEYDLVRGDVVDVGGVGIAAVLAVVLLFFRTPRALFVLGVTIGAGCAITFGLTELALGHLNVATAFLFSIVAGNGINFGIIWLARFLEARNAGRSLGVAIHEAQSRTFAATLTAACAAGAAYAALGIGHFRGFHHFAFIGGTGMLICWVATYLLLPPVVVLTERRRGRAAMIPRPFRRLERPFLWLVDHFPRPTWQVSLAIGVVALVLGGRYLYRGPLEFNMRKLESDPAATKAIYRVSAIAEKILFVNTTASMIVLTDDARDAPVLADVLRGVRDAAPPELRPFQEVHTLDDMVPARQPERLERLGKLAKRLRHDRDLGGMSDAQWSEIEPLLPPADLRPFGVGELPPEMVEPFTEKDGTRGRILYLEPTAGQNENDLHYLLRWAESFRATRLPDGRVVTGSGRAVIFADLLAFSLLDMPRSILLSLLATAFTVALLFRRPRPTAVVLGSLGVALVWMMGTLAATGVRLSFINFIALPITFGIGVDYPVNIYGRYAQERGLGIIAALRGAGAPVFLCSLTTSLGYLALLRAHNQAVRSLGAVAVIGEVTCLTSAVLLLPAILTWQQRRKAPSIEPAAAA